jgi:enterochelin esterase-like enzyme
MLDRMTKKMGKHIKTWLFILALLVSCILDACAPVSTITPIPGKPTPTPTLTPLPLPSTFSHPRLATPLSPTPTESCLSMPGQLVKGVINTTLLDKPMTYIVYLPPCYTQEEERRYPVLYLLHGQDNHEDQWIRLGVSAAMDKLITARDVSPFIIVFPYDPSHKQPPDYHFEDVFLQSFIPEIDKSYRTLPDAAHRAVGGLSRGGAWALHLGIHHPDVFGSIGAHSPAIFYSDSNSLPRLVDEIPSEKLPRIFIDIGDGDSEMEAVESFENYLIMHNIPHEWHEYIGYHEEKYWAAHVDEYLRWYAKSWK